MNTLFRTTSRAALIALVVAAPVAAPMSAIAQDASGSVQTDSGDPILLPDASATGETTADTSTDGTTDPMAPAAGTDAEVADGTAADPAVTDPAESEMNMADAEEPAKPVDGQITMQSESTILAEDLLGAPVFNGGDEKVGDISDLIISLDGGVEGVVIGVGGFLGMGQKDVAVQMAMLDVSETESGAPRLVTTATKADLEAAPAFVTAEQQARDAEALKMQSDTTGGSAVPVE